jgi:hypothetical protein
VNLSAAASINEAVVFPEIGASNVLMRHLYNTQIGETLKLPGSEVRVDRLRSRWAR